jgi:predicted ArsR family transcriptional regulator
MSAPVVQVEVLETLGSALEARRARGCLSVWVRSADVAVVLGRRRSAVWQALERLRAAALVERAAPIGGRGGPATEWTVTRAGREALRRRAGKATDG